MNPRRDILGPDRALKTGFRDLVLNRVGGVDAAVATVGVRVGRSQLGSWLNPHEDAFPRVDVTVALEIAAGEPVLTSEMARRSGFSLIPLEPMGEGDLAQGMAKLGAEVGQVFAAFSAALADGRITGDEADRMIREHQDILRVAKSYLAVLARIRSEIP